VAFGCYGFLPELRRKAMRMELGWDKGTVAIEVVYLWKVLCLWWGSGGGSEQEREQANDYCIWRVGRRNSCSRNENKNLQIHK
jgi:hypothetical protein